MSEIISPVSQEERIRIEIGLTFKDGIARDFFNVSGVLSKQLAGYRCVVQALYQAKSAIKKFFELSETDKASIVGVSLWTHAAIQYCKCYLKNDGWAVQLQISATLKNEPKELLVIHKWFINERNTFVAHGGVSDSQVSQVFISKKKLPPNEIDGIYINTLTGAIPTDEYLEALDKLIDASNKYSNEHYEKVKSKILSVFVARGEIISRDRGIVSTTISMEKTSEQRG